MERDVRRVDGNGEFYENVIFVLNHYVQSYRENPPMGAEAIRDSKSRTAQPERQDGPLPDTIRKFYRA